MGTRFLCLLFKFLVLLYFDTAVSYTHLDVYKRQAPGCAVLPVRAIAARPGRWVRLQSVQISQAAGLGFRQNISRLPVPLTFTTVINFL